MKIKIIVGCIAFALIILSIVLLKAQNNQKQVVPNIDFMVKQIGQSEAFKTASISICIKDCETGNSVGAFGENKCLAPASVLKTITTATALGKLGGDFFFQTQLEYTGSISDDCLNGNIIIHGGGDPVFCSNTFSEYYTDLMNKWAKQIQNNGIKKINGRIIGDASIYPDYLTPDTWNWNDIGNYYGASPSGLTIYDNTYTLYFKTGIEKGDKTEIVGISPYASNITIDNRIKTYNENEDEGYIFGSPQSNIRYTKGNLPKNKAKFSVKGSLPEPALVAATELDKSLKMLDITPTLPPTTEYLERLKDPNFAIEGRILLSQVNSPSLALIIHEINKYSINLYTEHLYRHLEYLDAEKRTGEKIIIQYLYSLGIDIKGLKIYDGCGLSRFNSISSEQLSGMMCKIKESKYIDVFLNSLPIAGVDGSFKGWCKGTEAQGRVFAKTGSIEDVRAYSGYVKSKSGKWFAFAFIYNNFTCDYSYLKKQTENILIELAKQ